MSVIPISLYDIAYARSGDKGQHANIGVIAYTPEGYDFLKKTLTEERVKQYFSPYPVSQVKRYELDHLLAFNFVLLHLLGEGGSRSPRIDAQGKALGQILLEMPLDIDSALYPSCQRIS